MRSLCRPLLTAGSLLTLLSSPIVATDEAPATPRLELRDVFELELATDPQISPDGSAVVYVRNSMDVLSDRRRSRLFIVDVESGDHRPISSAASGERRDSSPRWSPDGTRLLYVSRGEGETALHLRFMDSGQTAELTRLAEPARGLAWSPDGGSIAFAMLVPETPDPFVELPKKPEGAEWAAPPKVIDRLEYRADGDGYLDPGYWQIFVLGADGGTPRQLTSGPYRHQGPISWSPDGRTLLVAANRHPDWEYSPVDTEIYEIGLAGGEVHQLTDRRGPDERPLVSPDGRHIAYLGFDDRLQGYQITELSVMNRDGSGNRRLTADLDRDVDSPVWADDSRGLYFQYDDHGDTKLAYVGLDGKVKTLTGSLGGTSLGRPYSGGSFSAAAGRLAFTLTAPDHPADVALFADGKVKRLTWLNRDLLEHRRLGRVEEIRFKSSHDGRAIQGWIATPPDFDPAQKYPLILEIHGGPFANYGPRFAAEIQLFAAAGYVVLYVNPRGSTSYGEELGNLIHHNYPGEDYDDLMSGVDAVIARGYVDPERLFVTGGSGGGVLTSWIVGKTDRFRAAVVAKPVINWYSFVLTADNAAFFYKYWFPGFPWDHPEQYLKRSPLSLVGNVSTPTMLLTGELDYRTPMSESEQYYQALKLRRVPAALVRIPQASHGIAERPSYLMAKVAYILEWFGRYGGVKR